MESKVVVEVAYKLTQRSNDSYELFFPYFKECGVQYLTTGWLPDQYPDKCAKDYVSLVLYSMYKEGLLGFFHDTYVDHLDDDKEVYYTCKLTKEDFGKVQVCDTVE